MAGDEERDNNSTVPKPRARRSAARPASAGTDNPETGGGMPRPRRATRKRAQGQQPRKPAAPDDQTPGSTAAHEPGGRTTDISAAQPGPSDEPFRAVPDSDVPNRAAVQRRPRRTAAVESDLGTGVEPVPSPAENGPSQSGIDRPDLGPPEALMDRSRPDSRIPQEEIRFGVVLNGGVSLAVWMGGVVREIDDVTRALAGMPANPDHPGRSANSAGGHAVDPSRRNPTAGTRTESDPAGGNGAAGRSTAASRTESDPAGHDPTDWDPAGGDPAGGGSTNSPSGTGPPAHDTRSIYAFLLDLVRCRARADVVAGTSAGGINGAALGLAQLNRNADLASLRDIWADQGRMESLLREPFKGSPPSLLKGDEYFYPALDRALESLAQGWDPVVDESWSAPGEPQPRPLDLTITTTLLKGARHVTVDSMGQRIPEQIHDATFTFRTGPRRRGDGTVQDDFGEDRRPQTVRALALASRCTAGFPVAFEPSFVPVNATADGKPDMAPYASWTDQGVPAPGEKRDADVSRYAVDGGLLANMPTRHVLRAIQDMPARDPVRRVVLLIHPHAPEDAPVPPDRADQPPVLTGTLTGLLGALQAQGQRSYVADLDEHNRRATGRRTTRGDILRTISEDDPARLARLATDLWPHYRMLAARRLGQELSDSIAGSAGARRLAGPADAARREVSTPKDPMVLLDEAAGEPLSREALDVVAAAWGIDAAVGIADAANDYLRRLAWQVVDDPRTVMKERECVLQARRDLVAMRERDMPSASPAPDDGRPRASKPGLTDLSKTILGDPGQAGQQRGAGTTKAARTVADHLATIAHALARTAPAAKAVIDGAAPDPDLRLWAPVMLAPDNDATRLNRLYQVHIATTCIADEDVTESVNPFDVVQISLQTRDPFTVVTRSGDDKLAGMALHRFGGFLKRSWRMNDWTWGRLDAATMLSRIILDPQRLRRVALLSPEDSPFAAVAPGSDAQERAKARADELVRLLATRFLPASAPHDAGLAAAVTQARREAQTRLYRVFLPTGTRPDLPDAVPALADLAAWALHLRIITEELPAIASAIRVDATEGAHRRSLGQVLLAQHHDLLRRLAELPTRIGDDDAATHDRRLELGRLALRAFDRAGIGREPLAQEGASDQIIRTSTTAASVAVSVLDGERSGLAAAKPVTRTLRGGMLLPYWIVNGLTAGGGIARLLALGALALGGVLLTLSLLSVVGSWAAVMGAGIALFGLGYAALRTGTLLHGLVLLVPVVPLAVIGFEMRRNPATAAATSSGQIVLLAAVGLVIGLIVIGSLPAEVSSPAAVATDAGRRVLAWLRSAGSWLRRLPGWLARHKGVVALVVGAAVAVAAAVVWRDAWVGRLPWLAERLASATTWFVVLLVVGTAVGTLRAGEAGRQLRVYTRGTPGGASASRRRHATPAAAAPDEPASGEPTSAQALPEGVATAVDPPPGTPGASASTGGPVTPDRTWRSNDVVHPVGTASGWSVGYGIVAGVVALWLMRIEPRDTALDLLAWTFAVGALVLVAVVPIWLPARFWRRQARALAPSMPPLATAQGDVRQQAALLAVLVRRGMTYKRLVRPVPEHREVLRLTPFALRIAAHVPVPEDFVVLPETEVLSRRGPDRPRARWVTRGYDLAVFPEMRHPMPQPPSGGPITSATASRDDGRVR